MTVATVKYNNKPVTSTSVDTNGADELAGSAPNFLSKNGNIEPTNEPHNTTPKMEMETVKPINCQCGPYTSVNTWNPYIRIIPKQPSMIPNNAPAISSRLNTRHQSLSFTSPKAIA